MQHRFRHLNLQNNPLVKNLTSYRPILGGQTSKKQQQQKYSSLDESERMSKQSLHRDANIMDEAI